MLVSTAALGVQMLLAPERRAASWSRARSTESVNLPDREISSRSVGLLLLVMRPHSSTRRLNLVSSRCLVFGHFYNRQHPSLGK